MSLADSGIFLRYTASSLMNASIASVAQLIEEQQLTWDLNDFMQRQRSLTDKMAEGGSGTREKALAAFEKLAVNDDAICSLRENVWFSAADMGSNNSNSRSPSHTHDGSPCLVEVSKLSAQTIKAFCCAGLRGLGYGPSERRSPCQYAADRM